MNERVIEIAHEVFSFKYKTSPYEMNPGHHIDHIQKFAELIVEECIEVMYDTEQMEAAALADRILREHFGISK